MNINACIYDNEGNLAGCVTDSVISQFRIEMDGLRREFGEDGGCRKVLGVLEDACHRSEATCGAVFINALKMLLMGHRREMVPEFAMALSRAYHNLVRHCCSNVVYDEVLNSTIDQFREEGFEYLGTLDKVCGRDAYAFIYDNVHVSICMVDKNDLYNFWCKKTDESVRAAISFNGKVFLVRRVDGPTLCDAVRACVDDLRDSEESDGVDADALGELASVLVEVAESLLSKRDC